MDSKSKMPAEISGHFIYYWRGKKDGSANLLRRVILIVDEARSEQLLRTFHAPSDNAID
jgi:hypothetical protein